MILVDTSIWIEFFQLREPIATELQELAEAALVLAHAPVFAELLQGCKTAAEAVFVVEYREALRDSESTAGFVEGGRSGGHAIEKRLHRPGQAPDFL